MSRICFVSGIFQTNCKLFVSAKEKQETKKDISPGWPQNLVKQSSGNNLLNSRILKRVNCINWELKFSMKWKMSSLNIYFTFYKNDKFYYKSLKHTSFSAWFDCSRVEICYVKTIIVTSTKNG